MIKTIIYFIFVKVLFTILTFLFGMCAVALFFWKPKLASAIINKFVSKLGTNGVASISKVSSNSISTLIKGVRSLIIKNQGKL